MLQKILSIAQQPKIPRSYVEEWSPYLRKVEDMLKRVQRRATKIIEELQKTPHSDGLIHTDLVFLKERQIIGYLVYSLTVTIKF